MLYEKTLNILHTSKGYKQYSRGETFQFIRFVLSVGRIYKLSLCRFVISLQLRAEVGCLQGELEGKRAEMDTLDILLQRRERESQEGGNLLKMLTDDLQTAKEER